MGINHLITIDTVDSIIIAEQIVALSSFTLSICTLFWLITGFRKNKSLHKRVLLPFICFLSITCFTIFTLISSIGWTNVIFPISSNTCKILYPVGLIMYNIGKISMYWLFTFKIQSIFEHSPLSFTNNILWIYRISVAIISSILYSIWIYITLPDIKPYQIHKYSHCFPKRNTQYIDINSNIAAALTWSEFIFLSILIYIFLFKLFQVTHITDDIVINTLPSSPVLNGINTTHSMDDSTLTIYSQQQSIAQYKMRHSRALLSPTTISNIWIDSIRKCTMLCIIAIVSSWMYILGTVYILNQCYLFIPFDAVINSLCIALLFKFGDKCYNKCCWSLERCCIDIICCCCCGQKQQQYQYKASNSRSSLGCAVRLDNNYDIVSNAGEIVSKYTDLDFSLDSRPQSVKTSISSNILMKHHPEIIDIVQDQKQQLNGYDVHVLRKESIHNSETKETDIKPWIPKKFPSPAPKAHRRSPSPQLIHHQSPSVSKKKGKERCTSLSTVNDDDSAHSDQSATFMLLDDMSDDEHNDEVYIDDESYDDDDDEEYYDDDEALVEGDEDEVTITDEDSNGD